MLCYTLCTEQSGLRRSLVQLHSMASLKTKCLQMMSYHMIHRLQSCEFSTSATLEKHILLQQHMRSRAQNQLTRCRIMMRQNRSIAQDGRQVKAHFPFWGCSDARQSTSDAPLHQQWKKLAATQQSPRILCQRAHAGMTGGHHAWQHAQILTLIFDRMRLPWGVPRREGR